MLARWMPRTGALALIAIGVSGCQFMPFGMGQAAPAPVAPKPPPPLASRGDSGSALTADPTAMHPNNATADTSTNDRARNLADKVRTYTQDLSPRIDSARPIAVAQKRGSGDNADSPQQTPNTIYGSSNWLSPFAIELTPYAPERDKVTADKPAPQKPQETKIDDPPATAAPAFAPAAPAFAPAAPAPVIKAPIAPVPSVPINVPQGLEAPGDQLDKPIGDWQTRVKTRAREYPTGLDAQVDNQLLGYLQGQPTPQMNTLGGLSSEDREIASALLDGISNFRDGLRSDSNMLVSSKIQPLQDMTDRLRAGAELSIPMIALCSSVKSYGDYQPIEGNRIVALKANKLIIYCELANFASRLNSKNLWESDFEMDSTLYKEDGSLVWKDDTKNKTAVDQCRNRRHDMHLARIVTLPAELGIDKYLLKLTITDTQAHHVAETTTYVEAVAR